MGAWSSPSPRWQLPSGTGLCRTNCCTCRSSLWLTWATTLLRGRTVSFTREARVLRSFFEMPPSLSGRGHLVAGVTQWQDPPFTLRGRYEVVTRGCAKGRYEVITRVNTHVHYEVITSGHADGPSHYEVITWSLQAHFAGLSLRGHYEPLRNGLVMITRSLRAVTQWHCALRGHYEIITSKISPVTRSLRANPLRAAITSISLVTSLVTWLVFL